MEILSPLTKLLRWDRDPNLAQSSRRGFEPPSSGKTTAAQAAQRTEGPSGSSIFQRLYTLSPKELQRFVSQQLPFLNDPYFSKRLARTTSSVGAQVSGEGFEGVEKISDSYLVRDKSGGFWKAWVMPVALEGRLAKVTIYLSRQQQKKNKEKNKNRIILATELEHTGPIEIEADIFDRSLLLALRSTRPFSGLAQTGIRERFLQILEVVSFQGSINFYTVSSLSMDTLAPPTAWEVEL